MRWFTAIILLMAARAIILPAEGSSKWVRLGDGPRLHYLMDAAGNRIMDFSHAGYRGGGVRLPTAAMARTVGPAPGDNTARIQAAIDQVSSLAPGADGLRVSGLRAGDTVLIRRPVTEAWVRFMGMDTQNTITLGPPVRRATLENVRIRHHLPFTAPAGPADIAISGTQWAVAWNVKADYLLVQQPPGAP